MITALLFILVTAAAVLVGVAVGLLICKVVGI